MSLERSFAIAVRPQPGAPGIQGSVLLRYHLEQLYVLFPEVGATELAPKAKAGLAAEALTHALLPAIPHILTDEVTITTSQLTLRLDTTIDQWLKTYRRVVTPILVGLVDSAGGVLAPSDQPGTPPPGPESVEYSYEPE